MTRRFLTASLWMCLLAAPAAAWAQVTPAAPYTPPNDTPSINVGATLFLNYTFLKTPKGTDAANNAISTNSFDTARAYINITGNVSHVVAFRITPDISAFSLAGNGLSGSRLFRLKYGYGQFNLDDWTGNFKGAWVRLGIQQTPFVDYEENIYRYRFQGTVFSERESLLSSSDAGVSFHSNLPNNFGDFHVGIYNGEGYSAAETNDQKAFQVRGTIRPLARSSSLAARGLRVTGFYDADNYIKGGQKKRAVFNTTFEHKRFNAGFDFLKAKDQTLTTVALVPSQGWSFWATPFFKEKGNGLEMLLRYDSFKPSSTVDQTRQRTIVGVAYWFPHPGGNQTAALMLDFEQVKFDGFPAVAANATQQRIFLHGLIAF